ncbi:tRNA pseudouridine32 synthase / 23S rRNA pseudouridine746 synthase [Pseudoxanthomonas sp. GM95]|uniref:pseudouridine synthase n=1 Tax=Pseudoxanthomonas sp. GM95 TaxID=1881043 RepID=UPI0008B65788|nr:pseudouridine synthase [Pseudoxanthomonas sp. GM95]SEL85921.1 tRNA pseudouridine32 synthase / 23S rRNA pseudouridine746 synthase [Pseudoxanthomonas sp. GM95]
MLPPDSPVPVASRLQLPPGPWATLLEGLCARFPHISREQWTSRFARGCVQDPHGVALAADHPWRAGLELVYFREVEDETPIPFTEQVLHHDAHLLVADKPHFLPVVPAGRFVHETLLARLRLKTGCQDLVPLHRIDRLTAGLVLFSVNRQSRAAYQALFREHAITKRYEALAPALPEAVFPMERRSRLARGEPFFTTEEVPGEPNSLTHIQVLEQGAGDWRYGLEPVTGRKHQLRVHMAALGAPIRHDPWYPALASDQEEADDFAHPLKLLARSVAFVDPTSGAVRHFQSSFRL